MSLSESKSHYHQELSSSTSYLAKLEKLAKAVETNNQKQLEHLVTSREVTDLDIMLEAIESNNTAYLTQQGFKSWKENMLYVWESQTNTKREGVYVFLSQGELRMQTYSQASPEKNSTFILALDQNRNYFLQWTHNRGCFDQINPWSTAPKPITYKLNRP